MLDRCVTAHVRSMRASNDHTEERTSLIICDKAVLTVILIIHVSSPASNVIAVGDVTGAVPFCCERRLRAAVRNARRNWTLYMSTSSSVTKLCRVEDFVITCLMALLFHLLVDDE